MFFKSIFLILHCVILQSPLQSKSEDLSIAPDSVKVHLLSDLCFEYRFISQDSAIIFGEEAIALAIKINYKKGLAQAHNDLGIIYADQANVGQASGHYRQSLHIRKELGDSLGMASIYNKLGILYQKIGKLDSALSNQMRCLPIYEKKGYNPGISHTLNNIAIIFFNQGDSKRSLLYHEKALAIRSKMNDNLGIASSLGNIGNVYFESGQIEQCIDYYKKSFNTLKSLDALDHLGNICNNISNAYLKMKSLDSAKKYLSLSIEIREEINDVKGLISSYHNLGKLLLQEKQFVLAESYLNKSLNLATQHSVGSSLLDIHNTLMDFYALRGNYPEALMHAQLIIYLKDSLNNENTQRILVELQTKYETEKKEQQIALQGLEIAEQQANNRLSLFAIGGLAFALILLSVIMILARSRTKKKEELLIRKAEIKLRETQIEAAIISQESERKRFARDLHDGFGQMISVLNLNLKALEKGEPDREEVFANSSHVLDDMYKELKGICFNLMPETLIKSGVVDAIREFAHRINQTNKLVVEVDTFGIDKRLSDLQEISIYRITQEWINNILKYSDASKITISLTRDDQEITLLIEDNGSGFDRTTLTEGSGNGWKNMNSRANLIKGQLELDTTPEVKGSTLIVNVPSIVYTQEETTLKIQV